MTELWKNITENSPGVHRVERFRWRTQKVSTLEHLAPANIRSRALQNEVELQNQCLQLEKLKSTNYSLQNDDLVEFRQELDNHFKKAKETTKEVLGKWSAECESLRDNIEAAAARNAKQELSIELLKQELADLKVKAAMKCKAIDKLEKMNDQLRSKLEQREHYNQYLVLL